MDPPWKDAWIKSSHQELLVAGLNQFRGDIFGFAQRYLEETGMRMRVERMAQFVILLLLGILFGLVPGTTYSVLGSDAFQTTREHVARLDGRFPGKSTASLQVHRIMYLCNNNAPVAAALETLAKAFIDYFYAATGDAARAAFQAVLKSTRLKVTAPAECFVGAAKTSTLFPSLGASILGCITPFFNAWVYKQAKRGTSTAELVGALKEPCIEGKKLQFRLAGELGFVAGPPEAKKFYSHFQFIEANIGEAWNLASKQLAILDALDLTAVTFDGTNVAVDKRDTTGSVGTGSRGTFFGHKASIGAGANCLPAAATVAGGRASDPSLLEVTLAPVEALAAETNQDMWVDIMDAAYSSAQVVDRIEAGGAVPFVDLNPKNSPLLQGLKEAARSLKDLSKKAAKKGLTLEERKKWLGAARAISEERGERVPVTEKKTLLKRILRKFADIARRKGLAPGERRTEKKLRRTVMAARCEIQARGTAEEKKVGLLAVALGTVEWYLVYFLRGQNEGINGLLKKRGALIGEGQHTSWVVGHDDIDGRVRGDLAGICLVAAVKVRVTGTVAHPMRAIHNWSRRLKSFWVIFVVRFCRKTPKIKA
jgi:hypothetical protein